MTSPYSYTPTLRPPSRDWTPEERHATATEMAHMHRQFIERQCASQVEAGVQPQDELPEPIQAALNGFERIRAVLNDPASALERRRDWLLAGLTFVPLPAELGVEWQQESNGEALWRDGKEIAKFYWSGNVFDERTNAFQKRHTWYIRPNSIGDNPLYEGFTINDDRGKSATRYALLSQVQALLAQSS